MSYYDPGVWVHPNDSLIKSVEQKIQQDKYLQVVPRSSGFLPSRYSEYFVRTKSNQELLRLAEAQDYTGKITITLSEGNARILRQGHFNIKTIHQNPDTGVKVYPPHHMHFPTEKYSNLRRRPAYAYPVKCSSARNDILNKYCNDCN